MAADHEAADGLLCAPDVTRHWSMTCGLCFWLGSNDRCWRQKTYQDTVQYAAYYEITQVELKLSPEIVTALTHFCNSGTTCNSTANQARTQCRTPC